MKLTIEKDKNGALSSQCPYGKEHLVGCAKCHQCDYWAGYAGTKAIYCIYEERRGCKGILQRVELQIAELGRKKFEMSALVQALDKRQKSLADKKERMEEEQRELNAKRKYLDNQLKEVEKERFALKVKMHEVKIMLNNLNNVED